MIHYVYLGHFEHEGNFIRFEKHADTKPAWYRPVVVRPLDPAVIGELLAEMGLTPATVPADWGISFEEQGFLAWDRYTRSREARQFVKRLALRTRCDLADYSSLSFLTPDDLGQTEPMGPADQAIAKAVL